MNSKRSSLWVLQLTLLAFVLRGGFSYQSTAKAGDDFAGAPVTINGPGFSCAVVTPSDSTDLTHYARGLWVGTAGTVTLIPADGGASTPFVCQSGSIIPQRTKRVLATGTTATNIVEMY